MTLAIIGLGYVGLPLAVEFARRRDVIGLDSNTARVDALRAGHDATREVLDAKRAQALRTLLRGEKPARADVKSSYDRHARAATGITVWRL